MSVQAKYLKDENNNVFSPITSTQSVIGLQGNSIADFVGSQSQSNGYCYLHNGLLIHYVRLFSNVRVQGFFINFIVIGY